jgi:hypothetical protein
MSYVVRWEGRTFPTAHAAHAYVDALPGDVRAALVAGGYRVVLLCCPGDEPEPCKACHR